MTLSLRSSLASLRSLLNPTYSSFGLIFGTLKVGQMPRKSSIDASTLEASLLLYEVQI